MNRNVLFFRVAFTVFSCASIFLYASDGIAQETINKADTLKPISIDGIVVTANRYENKILNTGASVSTLGKATINHLPVNHLSNTLKFIPGIFTTSTDGMGLNPQVSIRGFHGGGEAEYLKVLVDGIPINNLENGLVSWNMMPLFNIYSIEALRGGSSALYGDAAMGGVINIITDKPEKSYTQANFGYGSFNSFNIGLNHGGKFKTGIFELYTNVEGTDGFRDHSKWNSVTVGGKTKLSLGLLSTLTIQSFGQMLNFDNPGPISEGQVMSDRLQSSPFYKYDGNDYKRAVINADFRHKVNFKTDLSISLGYQRNESEVATTFTQPPVILDMFTFTPIGLYDTTLFGNTKIREITIDQVHFAVRMFRSDPTKLFKTSGGIEANFGLYDNKVFDAFQGFISDYLVNGQKDKKLEFAGNGYRIKSAAYLNGEVPLFNDLKLIAGLRYDLISDAFESDIPIADTTLNKTYHAVSPKVALNLSTGETSNYKGSVYGGYSQAFKAPTIDQRTDLKSLSAAIFFEAGPYYQMLIINSDPYSNADLKPQRSNNFEIGAYQYYRFSKRFAAEISLTGYFIMVKDEIDFDLTEFKYRNISSSRHTGLESNLNLYYRNHLKGFINLNTTEVRFASGNNKGNYLKGIPSLFHISGISYEPESGFGGSLSFFGASGMYLDDENTTKLDPYLSINARFGYSFASTSVYLDIENIFDKLYNSTGYLFYGTKYLYPAVGRFIRGGISVSI